MSSNVADLEARRLDKTPDIVMTAKIRGIHTADKCTMYQVVIEGESDIGRAASILRHAADVLADPNSTDIS